VVGTALVPRTGDAAGGRVFGASSQLNHSANRYWRDDCHQHVLACGYCAQHYSSFPC
jgi:hypothetical protein